MSLHIIYHLECIIPKLNGLVTQEDLTFIQLIQIGGAHLLHLGTLLVDILEQILKCLVGMIIDLL